MEFWQKLTGWVGSGFSVLVYAAIIALFLLGIFRCVVPVSHNRKRLKSAISQIKQGDKARRSWQEDRFLGRGSLMPHWSEYLNNLFFADGEYHNPANVEDYINEDTVIDGPGKAKLGEALPGILVSLGFLGTLLGLSLALGEMNRMDASNISASMDTLLSSMKYAFLTYIFGVVASIAFNLILRGVTSKAENTLTEFYNAMSKHAGVLSVDPLTQVAIYQQEQTGLLKEMKAVLSPENVQAMIETVTGAADFTSEKQRELMDGVAEAYIDRMNAMFGGQMERFSQVIEKTADYQEKTLKSVTSTLSEITKTSEALTRMKQDTFALIDKCGQFVMNLRSSVEATAEANAEFKRILDSESTTLETISELADEMRLQARAANETAQSLAQSSAALSQGGVKAIESAADTLVKSGEAIAKCTRDSHALLERDIDESLSYFEGCMTQIIKRVEKASKALNAASHAGGGAA